MRKSLFTFAVLGALFSGCTCAPASLEGKKCDDGGRCVAGYQCDAESWLCVKKACGEEVCNGADDDCDGKTDEALAQVSGFPDGDGDGFGEEGSEAVTGCVAGATLAPTADDCDDTNPFVFPGATDMVGDGEDRDCDGDDGTDFDRDGEASVASGGTDCDDTVASCTDDCETDADADEVRDCEDGCIDSDGDRYGLTNPDVDPTRIPTCLGLDCDDTSARCTDLCSDADRDNIFDCKDDCLDLDLDGFGAQGQNSGCAIPTVDCDDLDSNVYPGAPERCNGELDDCTGTLPANESDGDGDKYVACTNWIAGHPTLLGGGDCDDGEPAAFPGNLEICDTLDNDCDGFSDSGPAFCECGDPDLVACWRFDGDATDGSIYGNDAATSGNISYVTGIVDQAVQLDGTTNVSAADSASLDSAVNALTLEAWIKPDSLPTGGRVGILDDDGQWGMFIYANDELRCSAGGWMNNSATITVGVWQHVACTWDGTTLRSYLNGTEVNTMAVSGALNAGNTNDTTIGMNSPSGDHFDGAIDNVRIWRVARSPTDICRAAGSCP